MKLINSNIRQNIRKRNKGIFRRVKRCTFVAVYHFYKFIGFYKFLQWQEHSTKRGKRIFLCGICSVSLLLTFLVCIMPAPKEMDNLLDSFDGAPQNPSEVYTLSDGTVVPRGLSSSSARLLQLIHQSGIDLEMASKDKAYGKMASRKVFELAVKDSLYMALVKDEDNTVRYKQDTLTKGNSCRAQSSPVIRKD